MQEPITLRGMTWNHTRGYTPMVATAQRFAELNPDINITWEKRSLQEFADQPIDRLADAYDLLVIDHPWAGFAAASGVLVPLDLHVSAQFLQDQATNSVGKSHESYHFDEHHWALAIDAATPVSAYRLDLLERAGCSLPRTWDETIALGRRGFVCCPSIPLDTFCNFMNLCASAGAVLFPDAACVVARPDGRTALHRLRELAAIVPREFFGCNPIRTLELMSSTDDFVYCPFTYGYSNYSRPGYAPEVVQFGDVIEIDNGRPGVTMLGGTGLAISSHCRHVAAAARYAEFVASALIQRGLYFECGGQPGHRGAWLDETVNAACSNFFRDTLPALDRAFVRPRYNGYLEFQDRAGDPIHAFLRDGGNVDSTLDQLDELYRQHHGGAA